MASAGVFAPHPAGGAEEHPLGGAEGLGCLFLKEIINGLQVPVVIRLAGPHAVDGHGPDLNIKYAPLAAGCLAPRPFKLCPRPNREALGFLLRSRQGTLTPRPHIHTHGATRRIWDCYIQQGELLQEVLPICHREVVIYEQHLSVYPHNGRKGRRRLTIEA